MTETLSMRERIARAKAQTVKTEIEAGVAERLAQFTREEAERAKRASADALALISAIEAGPPRASVSDEGVVMLVWGDRDKVALVFAEDGRPVLAQRQEGGSFLDNPRELTLIDAAIREGKDANG